MMNNLRTFLSPTLSPDPTTTPDSMDAGTTVAPRATESYARPVSPPAKAEGKANNNVAPSAPLRKTRFAVNVYQRRLPEITSSLC